MKAWEVRSGNELFTIEPEGGTRLAPSSSLTAARCWSRVQPGAERIGFYSTVDGREIDSLDIPGVQVSMMAIDGTGDRLAIGSQASQRCKCGI